MNTTTGLEKPGMLNCLYLSNESERILMGCQIQIKIINYQKKIITFELKDSEKDY